MGFHLVSKNDDGTFGIERRNETNHQDRNKCDCFLWEGWGRRWVCVTTVYIHRQGTQQRNISHAKDGERDVQWVLKREKRQRTTAATTVQLCLQWEALLQSPSRSKRPYFMCLSRIKGGRRQKKRKKKRWQLSDNRTTER